VPHGETKSGSPNASTTRFDESPHFINFATSANERGALVEDTTCGLVSVFFGTAETSEAFSFSCCPLLLGLSELDLSHPKIAV